jgi:DNA polymerase V
MKPVFVLVDCNNFFVSCERAFRPDLWDKPVAVLSNNDGCIVARSNEVKAMGVPMGVPYFEVRDVLKQGGATLFSGNFSLYGDFSQRVVQILQDESPDIEVYSVDESFLEVSHLAIKDYTAWGRALAAKIKQWTGIPVSVGIAPTKTLAKAAADFAKKNPNQLGTFNIAGNEQARIDLLTWLPLQDIWGIGWRTAPKLKGRGIKNAYELSLVSDNWALEQLTIRGLKTVRELRGESCIPLENQEEPQQSIARTRSFGHNVRNYYELEGAVATFAASAAVKLRKQGEVATAVLTFLRGSKHVAIQHGSSQVVKLHPPSAETGALIAAALDGLKQVYDPDFSYKKAGVVLLGLTTVRQMAFNTDPTAVDRQIKLMTVVDQLNARYTTRLVRHASEHPEITKWRSKQQLRSPAYTTNWLQLRKVMA